MGGEMRFVYDAPALLFKGALIIGDTHFGIESRLKQKGIHQENFSEIMLDKIKALLKETKAKRLIILGDAKENILYADEITKRIFTQLQKICEVIVVKGNHDGGIEAVCKNVKPVGGYVYEGLALVHGNAWPSEELMLQDYLVCAHQHPMIEIKDSFERIHSFPAWLFLGPSIKEMKKRYKTFNKKIKLVLLPAFNPLAGKSMKVHAQQQLGPLLSNKLFKLSQANVYTLQGSYLGRLKNLEKGFGHGKQGKGKTGNL